MQSGCILSLLVKVKIAKKKKTKKTRSLSHFVSLYLHDPLGPSPDPEICTTPCDNSHNDAQLAEIQTPKSPANKLPLDVSTQKNEQKAKHHGHSHSHGHSHGGNCHSDQEMKDAGVASIAWMVIMGDGMHNFSDGLAIGESYYLMSTVGHFYQLITLKLNLEEFYIVKIPF